MYFSTMGVSKASISKFLIGNRFHVKLRILSPYSNRDSIYRDCGKYTPKIPLISVERMSIRNTQKLPECSLV